jgi:hypothetical protein
VVCQCRHERVLGRAAAAVLCSSQIPLPIVAFLPQYARDEATYVDALGTRRLRRTQFVMLDYHPATLRQWHARYYTSGPSFAELRRHAQDLLRVRGGQVSRVA